MDLPLLETPSLEDKAVTNFCSELSHSHPVLIDYAPDKEASPFKCCFNVYFKCQRDGGKMVAGWDVLTIKKFYLEAVFHAVWESPKGNLIDITPNPPADPRTHTLFLPDTSFNVQIVNGRIFINGEVSDAPPNNRYAIVGPKPIVQKFIDNTKLLRQYEQLGQSKKVKKCAEENIKLWRRAKTFS